MGYLSTGKDQTRQCAMSIMDEELALFVKTATFISTESVTWDGDTLPLRIAFYFYDQQPPRRYVSSVHAIVLRDQSVLVVTDPANEMYILPGGRVEEGELPLETLKREVLEETGWTLGETELFGFMHLHHLGVKPEKYKYPYPDFIWPVYLAEADSFRPGAIIPDAYVSESRFYPILQIRQLPIKKGELLLFEEALRRRRPHRIYSDV
jgi:8-oxo-dGTP pyrophosphatase MutT (NUDIX family)